MRHGMLVDEGTKCMTNVDSVLGWRWAWWNGLALPEEVPGNRRCLLSIMRRMSKRLEADLLLSEGS